MEFKCLECGVNMGNNPRQLCGKTRCLGTKIKVVYTDSMTKGVLSVNLVDNRCELPEGCVPASHFEKTTGRKWDDLEWEQI